MNPLDKNEQSDFAIYFKSLGYGYSWDFDKTLRWHNILKDDRVICQIEMVSLKQIITDMCIVEEIEVPYYCACFYSTEHLYKKLCNEVRQFENKSKLSTYDFYI